MEVAPFFVDFHHFLSIFIIFYRFSRFTHFCRDLHFVAISALFPQFFFGQNSLLRNITHFLHVWLFGERSPSSVIRSKLFAKSVFTTSMPILWATYYRWSTLLFVGMTTLPEERRSGKKEERGVRQAIIFWVCWLPSTLFEVSWNTNTFILYG